MAEAISSDAAWAWRTGAHAAGLALGVLLASAVVIYADRKIFAGAQKRKGPNVVGPFGLLQPIADLIKFLLKELVIPDGADRPLFLLAPLVNLIFAFGACAVIPLGPGWALADVNVGLLYLLGVSSMAVYGVIMGGWASNSKYAFLGAVRSASQMISYEVSIGLVLVTVVLLSGSLDLTAIAQAQSGGFWRWNIFGGGSGWPLALVMIPMALVYFVCTLAETNRPPFDLPEAESELVAGYAVEYGSALYMMFYLAETLNILLLCTLAAILFLGGWDAPAPIAAVSSWPAPAQGLFGLAWLAAKSGAVFLMNATVRIVTPRYRYDQLMRLGWKVFLPASLAAVVCVAALKLFLPR